MNSGNFESTEQYEAFEEESRPIDQSVQPTQERKKVVPQMSSVVTVTFWKKDLR